MPPIQQQQTSRAGLITALVFAIIACFGFLIWAIMNNSDLTKAQASLKAQQQKYNKVISDQQVNDLSPLQGAFSLDPASPRTGTLIEAATAQKQSIVKPITGNADSSEKEALDAYKAALDKVRNSAALKGQPITADSLTKVIESLVTKIENDQKAVAKAQDDVKAAQAALQAATAEYQKNLTAKDQQLAAAQAETTKEKASVTDEQKKMLATAEELGKKVTEIEKQASDQAQAHDLAVKEKAAEIEKLNKKLREALEKLAIYRMDVRNTAIRNIDCTITQIGADNTCYVNLGFGDHVVVGLTFEVYDKLDGVPKLGEGTSNFDLPKGKGSIEVIEVGATACRCRIVATKQGTQLSQGDVCANLVYDKNVKPLFYVFGDFDMDQNNVATPGEAEIIKGLIQRWGGRIADKLTVDVDFVVMGKEPVVPVFTKEELENPINRARLDDATKKLKDYEAVRGDASTLHIPVMNQNRFLYYVGYFDMSKR